MKKYNIASVDTILSLLFICMGTAEACDAMSADDKNDMSAEHRRCNKETAAAVANERRAHDVFLVASTIGARLDAYQRIVDAQLASLSRAVCATLRSAPFNAERRDVSRCDLVASDDVAYERLVSPYVTTSAVSQSAERATRLAIVTLASVVDAAYEQTIR